MPHIAGHNRSQLLLLPESVDDYVGPENPVRFIEAFVEGLDLPAAGFARVEPEETGRPGYRPADLLKLYIYGYLNRIRSSRRLEAETHRNIEVIWLLRHLNPDFKTIADFRRENRKAFRPVFRQFVLLCKQLDLFGRELLAVDGTRIIQVAVDTKHKLIVEQQVTNQVVDMGLLTQTAAPAKEVLGVEKIAVVADRGYFKIEDIEACEQAGIEPYVPRPQRGPSVKAGLFRKDEFQYDADSDSYICPAGQRLFPYSSSLLRGLKKINYTNKLACDDCKIRSRCTNGRFRTVSRLENEAVLDRMQVRLVQRPGVLDRRREAVEHPFCSIKQWMNQGAFLMRGLEKVRAEFSLTALAYNLRRVLNLRRVHRVDGRPGGLKSSCLSVSERVH
jgi:transposase